MLEISDVTVEFPTPIGWFRAVDKVSLNIASGEIVGLVGESGSGKSVLVKTVLGLIPTPPAEVRSGTARLNGQDLLSASSRQLQRLRGKEIGFIPQDPLQALNPMMTVGRQIGETIRAHNDRITAREIRRHATELLEIVRVPSAAARLDQYPHQFSGGMAQRVAIAIAIANSPRLIVADEPTTALDVTVQAEVMRALLEAQRAVNAAILLITHDLGLVAEVAGRVAVMYAGRIVEAGRVVEVYRLPRHPYTAGLLASTPRIDKPNHRLLPIRGQPPQPMELGSGCSFVPRCDFSAGRMRCQTECPALTEFQAGRASACHYASELTALNAIGSPG